MHVNWRTIDLETWDRRSTFFGFHGYDFPYLVIGADLRLGSLVDWCKRHAVSPYLAVVYVMTRAANEIAAFRLRIRGDEVIEHDVLHADYTVPVGETFAIKRVPYVPAFAAFAKAAEATPAHDFPPVVRGSDDDYAADPWDDHWVYMSCLPWFSFTHAVQPASRETGSITRVVWGRWYERDGEMWLPLSLQAHHGLVDGLHTARLFERIETLFHDPAATFLNP